MSIKKNNVDVSEDLLKWNLDLRDFLLYSNKHWRDRYPRFRANYQGDKMIGYALAQNIVEVPKQYKILQSLNFLTEDMIKRLPSKSFVIKETLGHAGSRVLCMFYDVDKKIYIDCLHHSKEIREFELLRYIMMKLDHNSSVIIEELLPFEDLKMPPPDFKVYMVLGKPRLINVYFRFSEGRFEASFKPIKSSQTTLEWKRIPLKELYQNLESLQYSDLPAHIPFVLPKLKTRLKLLEIATKLARAHNALFVRYDFYVIKDRIVLGEITPLCGGIRNNMLKRTMLSILFPDDVRKAYLHRQIRS